MRRRAQSAAKWIVTAAVVVALLTAAGFATLHFMRPLVMVTEAVEGPVVQAFYSTGTVQPEREYSIKSNVAGIVTEVKVDKGSVVRKGDALAVVSAPELKFEIDRAQAEVNEKQKRAEPKTSPVVEEFTTKIAAAEEIFAIAQREQKRVEELVRRNAASQSDFDKALERLKQTWGELESLKAASKAKQLELQKDLEVASAALATAKWNLDQQTLKSPVDGVILDRPVSAGTRMAINDLLMRVADVSAKSLVMRAAVDEEDVGKVRSDQIVRMTLYSFPDRTLVGKVSRVYEQADPERRTFEVDVRFDVAEKQLLPGMTGELAFIMSAREKALVIPSQAVQGDAVWAVAEGNRLARRQPQIGLRSIERAEVLAGVKPGDRIVISAIGDAKEGQHVRTSYVDPITAAGLNRKAVEEQPFKAFD